MIDSSEQTKSSIKDIRSQGEKERSKLPEINIEKMILYHGSGIGGIQKLKAAEETTLGYGIYLTSEITSAMGYARRRARRSNSTRTPTVYEVEIENVKLADFRKPETLRIFAQLLKGKLEELLQRNNLPPNVYNLINETIDMIEKDKYQYPRDLMDHFQDTTVNLLQEQGFDGLIAMEGGEGEDVYTHNSYVIFDTNKTKIIQETKF